MSAIVTYRPKRRKKSAAPALSVPAITMITRREALPPPPEPASVPIAETAAREPIATAPRDGTPICVLYGPQQRPVRARWHGSLQGWIAVGDPLRRVLHGVREWVPE